MKIVSDNRFSGKTHFYRIVSRVVGLDLDLADPLTMEWERRVVEKFEGLAEEIESEGSGLFFLPFIKRR